MRVIIVSGMSGAGKSVALHTLEDEGFFCVDNLPGSMLQDLIDNILSAKSPHHENIAVGIDARSASESIAELLDNLKSLSQREDLTIEILFLETNRETLLKRFSETRRRHPLTSKGVPLPKAIENEVEFLLPLKERADLVRDTSRLNLHQLREIIISRMIDREPQRMALLFQSFGFKYGPPTSSDFVFDVRCLPNPYWNTSLRQHSGLEQPVREFLESSELVEDMFSHIRDFLGHWLGVFEKENRAYLTVSIGCTGGRHRSVYLASRLSEHFSAQYANVTTRHRELQ